MEQKFGIRRLSNPYSISISYAGEVLSTASSISGVIFNTASKIIIKLLRDEPFSRLRVRVDPNPNPVYG